MRVQELRYFVLVKAFLFLPDILEIPFILFLSTENHVVKIIANLFSIFLPSEERQHPLFKLLISMILSFAVQSIPFKPINPQIKAWKDFMLSNLYQPTMRSTRLTSSTQQQRGGKKKYSSSLKTHTEREIVSSIQKQERSSCISFKGN